MKDSIKKQVNILFWALFILCTGMVLYKMAVEPFKLSFDLSFIFELIKLPAPGGDDLFIS